MINLMNTDTLSLFFISWNMSYYLWTVTWMKNVNNSKSSTSGYRLAFACIGVAYKSVAYKKSEYYVETKII